MKAQNLGQSLILSRMELGHSLSSIVIILKWYSIVTQGIWWRWSKSYNNIAHYLSKAAVDFTRACVASSPIWTGPQFLNLYLTSWKLWPHYLVFPRNSTILVPWIRIHSFLMIFPKKTSGTICGIYCIQQFYYRSFQLNKGLSQS